MRYAFAYGADAVYAGQPRYSLRVRNNEFNHENLQLGINEAHALGKKFYVVVNIAPHNAKLKTFIRDLKPVVEMGPDALISVRSGFNHAGAGTLPGDADPSFSAGQRCQLGDGQILAADGAHPRDPVA